MVSACNRGYNTNFIVMFQWNITPLRHCSCMVSHPVHIFLATGPTSFYKNLWTIKGASITNLKFLVWIKPETSPTRGECSTTKLPVMGRPMANTDCIIMQHEKSSNPQSIWLPKWTQFLRLKTQPKICHLLYSITIISLGQIPRCLYVFLTHTDWEQINL